MRRQRRSEGQNEPKRRSNTKQNSQSTRVNDKKTHSMHRERDRANQNAKTGSNIKETQSTNQCEQSVGMQVKVPKTEVKCQGKLAHNAQTARSGHQNNRKTKEQTLSMSARALAPAGPMSLLLRLMLVTDLFTCNTGHKKNAVWSTVTGGVKCQDTRKINAQTAPQ